MSEKTYDEEDPRDLPDRFAYSPVTGEVFYMCLFDSIIRVVRIFENRHTFHRFLEEGNKTDYEISGKVMRQAENILRARQEGDNGNSSQG